MNFLYLLEGIRTPVLNAIMSVITKLGEETVLIVLAVLIFWCFSKKEGYYLIVVGFFGMIINQFLKVIFRIPRPWVIDENFTIVESSKEAATGYSFPSGHTQNAVGLFGSIARFISNWIVRIILVALILLVAFSRMYLGVHTPLDVFVSLGIGTLLVFAIYPLMKKYSNNNIFMGSLLGIIIFLSIIALIFMTTYKLPADTDFTNINSGINNCVKIIGSSLGLIIAYFIEKKYVDFSTKGNILTQTIKVVFGFLGIIIIKSLLKNPINFIFGSLIGNSVRYFLIIVFAVLLWPMLFKYIENLTCKILKKTK